MGLSGKADVASDTAPRAGSGLTTKEISPPQQGQKDWKSLPRIWINLQLSSPRPPSGLLVQVSSAGWFYFSQTLVSVPAPAGLGLGPGICISKKQWRLEVNFQGDSVLCYVRHLFNKPPHLEIHWFSFLLSLTFCDGVGEKVSCFCFCFAFLKVKL